MILVNETTVCVYSYKSSCIAHGGVDNEKNLVFNNWTVLENTTLENMDFLLKPYGAVYINRHEPLKIKLGSKCKKEYDFKLIENESELDSLLDYFIELKANKKLKFPNNIKPNMNEANEIKTIQLFIKVNLESLMREPADYSSTFGLEPRFDRYERRFFTQYERSFYNQ